MALSARGRALRFAVGVWCVLVLLSAPSRGLKTYGPFTLAPTSGSSCPSTCKVRDVSIFGKGSQSIQNTTDACIDVCRGQRATHYTYSSVNLLCGCGNCTSGFVSGQVNSGVVSGRISSCQIFPNCSNTIKVGNNAQVCKCPGNTACQRGSLKFTFQCCCLSNYPVVFGGKLSSCSPNGA